MAIRDTVVVGASAGGVPALRTFLSSLPEDLPAAVFVVMHIAPDYKSKLPEIVNAASAIPAAHAEDREPILPGRIYIAPPDYHLVVEEHRMRVVKGPKENRSRPSVDVLFRSAAYVRGPRVIGVVLTGYLDDGTAGSFAVKLRGGVVIVQDPIEAEAPSMPESALRNVDVDWRLPLAEIGPKVAKLVGQHVSDNGDVSAGERMKAEIDLAKDHVANKRAVEGMGGPSRYACPECHGVLVEIREGKLKRYRCRTGHAYSRSALLAELADAAEPVLWSGLRAVEEVEDYARGFAVELRESGQPDLAQEVEMRANKAASDIEALRQIVLRYRKPLTD